MLPKLGVDKGIRQALEAGQIEQGKNIVGKLVCEEIDRCFLAGKRFLEDKVVRIDRFGQVRPPPPV